ncbi:MAG: MBL fold metallo-hydrolase [Treponema sp.]|nr:MBL fold metallo-hydrolase [Treponema sp.]
MDTIYNITVGAIATNCWVYPLNEDRAEAGSGFSPCAVIDPGEEGSRIISCLDQHKLYPKYILLTHGHFDHIAAVPALVAEYRKRQIAAPIVAIHAADAEYLGPDSYAVHCRSARAAMGSSAFIDALWEDMPTTMPAPDRILAEGDTIGPFTILHLPGHTPGSIGILDAKTGVLFTGDTLFCDGYGRTDLPGGSGSQLVASLKRLFALDSTTQIYPGHGPADILPNSFI